MGKMPANYSVTIFEDSGIISEKIAKSLDGDDNARDGVL